MFGLNLYVCVYVCAYSMCENLVCFHTRACLLMLFLLLAQLVFVCSGMWYEYSVRKYAHTHTHT